MAKAKAKARKGREVTCILKSFSMFFETLICMFKCSSVFRNTTTTDAGKKDKGEEEGEKGGN